MATCIVLSHEVSIEMKREEILHYLNEFKKLHTHKLDEQEFLIEATLFIEDLLHITLTDEEITDKNMGSHDALKSFILVKLQLEDTCAESAE